MKNCIDDAEGYFTLGIIHQAANRDDLAQKAFEKAVYLQPTHSEALMCLLLLAENQGDEEKMGILKRRLKKLSERQDLTNLNPSEGL